MRVTRIEIFGFKSFMERLVLPLDSGVTGVVGPNGCGKSNIVDALRWVLGETRASSLRGDVLEDVIFNGTENLRPLGLAEVTITLRSSEKDFFSDLVSPSLEADAVTSALLAELQNTSEKLEEMQSEEDEQIEQELDETNMESPEKHERPKLVVIKGNLGEPENNQSEELSVEGASEEVVGGVKIEAPERKPNAAQVTFLSRFSWLKSAQEVQVTRRLYRSGDSEFFINRVPCRLKDLKDLFRALGLGARAYTIVAQGEVSRIVSAKPEERRLILEEAAGVLGFRDKISAAKRRLEDTAVNISRLQDLIGEMGRQVSVLKRQAQRARDRQALKDEIRALDFDIFVDKQLSFNNRVLEVQSKVANLEQEEANALTNLAKVQALEHEARGSLMTVDVETDVVRSKIDAIREEFNQRAQQRSAGQSRVNELKAYAVSATNEGERLQSMITTLEARALEYSEQILKLKEQEASLAEEIANLDKETKTEDLRSVASEIDDAKQKLKQHDIEMRAVRDQLVSATSVKAQLFAQLQASSPLAQLRSALELNDGNFAENLDAKLLVECLEIDPGYSKAVQAVLSEKAEFLYSSEPHKVARYFLEQKAKLQTDSTSQSIGMGVIALGSDESATDDSHISDELEPSLERLSSFVREKGASLSSSLVCKMLHNVFLVKDVFSALDYFERNNSLRGVTLVTKEGEVVTASSFIALNRDGGLIQLKSKADECERQQATLQDKYDHLSEERNVMSGLIQELEAKQTAIIHAAQERQARFRELSNQHGSIIGHLRADEKLVQQTNEDLQRTKNNLSDLSIRIEKYRAEEVVVLEQLQEFLSVDDPELKDELEKLKIEHGRLDEIRKRGHENLSKVAEELDTARKSLDACRAALSHGQLESQKLTLEKSSLEERILSDYGAEFFEQIQNGTSQAVMLSEQEASEKQDKVMRLKAKMHREGEVDPTSIERYEEENTRLENLKNQLNDLESAAGTLKKTIELLTETSKERYLATFAAVNRNFSGLIPRVFGGGKASLLLTDEKNPLESGVEIAVRPPGKKLRSIELLSGGEKALCATALIFAMFLERPSPLCVLDEVDAPLDDANLVRLLALIKEMSARTQFIMITHNKQSMTMSDRLVGVTMQEPGASRVISVSLQEAFSQVA